MVASNSLKNFLAPSRIELLLPGCKSSRAKDGPSKVFYNFRTPSVLVGTLRLGSKVGFRAFEPPRVWILLSSPDSGSSCRQVGVLNGLSDSVVGC